MNHESVKKILKNAEEAFQSLTIYHKKYQFFNTFIKQDV